MNSATKETYQIKNSYWVKFWNDCNSGDYMACYNLHRIIGFPFYYFAIKIK